MQSARPLRIVIPGGTGHIGQILARHFHEQGHAVATIARHPAPAEWQAISWNGSELGPWAEIIDGSDVVINLAGRSVNCRYTAANRREIRNSRVFTTELINQAIARAAKPPKVWLNASTATIYRHTFENANDELSNRIGGEEPDAPAKWRFSIEVATAWENALFARDLQLTRRVALRSAIVMSPETGGAFDVFLRLVRWGLGGTAGSGRQYVSWIHDVDFVRAVEFLIAQDQLSGAINLASPYPLPNRKFMSCLRRAWCTSYVGISSPAWLLPLGAMVMRTETELVLKSRRVVPGTLLKAGFDFHFPNWRSACQDLVARWREIHAD